MTVAPRARTREANVDARANETLASQVYLEVRDAIVSLRIPPGVPLSEWDVSRRFGASRTPVRAALSRLEREGLLMAHPDGGKRRLIVPPLTAADMRQLFLMVGALNGVAARLAAELPEEARSALVVRLQGINEELRQATGDVGLEVRKVEEIDGRFHRAYEDLVEAPQLVRELESLGARRTRYIRLYTEALLHGGNLQESLTEHEAIIAAIERGEADRAELAAGFNYRQALGRFATVVEARGGHVGWFEPGL